MFSSECAKEGIKVKRGLPVERELLRTFLVARFHDRSRGHPVILFELISLEIDHH